MPEAVYAETSRNPLSRVVRLDEDELKLGRQRMPLTELNLLAMADAYLNHHWLGGGGAIRPLTALGDGKGLVPIIRSTGSAVPVRVRRASEFARGLGALAVRRSGGASAVARQAAQAHREGVPLWIARRIAQAPSGPITVTVDRQLARVYVSSSKAPPIRLAGEFGPQPGTRRQELRLIAAVGDEPATVTPSVGGWRRAQSSMTVESASGRWEMRADDRRTSQLSRDGRLVARLTRAPARSPQGTVIFPLAQVDHESGDPLDHVMAHFFAVAFGLGDATGTVKLRMRLPLPVLGDPALWNKPWYTTLGPGFHDTRPSARGSDDGNVGGDGVSGDDGGGSSGGDGGGGGGGE